MEQVLIATLVSDSKAYSLNQYLRTIRQLEYPRDKLQLVVVHDAERSNNALAIINHFMDTYPDLPATIIAVPTPENTALTEELNWPVRARICARLRQAAVDFAREQEPDSLFFAGCDMLFAPDTLTRLTAHEAPNVTGVYQARVQNFPVLCLHNMQTNEWRPIPYRQGISKVDWSGLDCFLTRRVAYEQVDWQGFSDKRYNAGEDAWYCLEANQKLKTRVAVDPLVTPLHIDSLGRVFSPLPFQPELILWTCPYCQTQLQMERPYRDISVGCPGCRLTPEVAPFDQDLQIAGYMKGPQQNPRIY